MRFTELSQPSSSLVNCVVTGTSDEARGSRSGRQVFSSLTSGYEMRTPDSLISPYTRLQYTRTWFDGYSETGTGAYSLAFAPQTVSQVTAGAGLRGERRVPARWGWTSSARASRW